MDNKLIPYGEAWLCLSQRFLGLTHEEVAAWLWNGHLPAYCSPLRPAEEENRASFLDDVKRPDDWRDWWFDEADIAAFVPRRRYLTYSQVVARFGQSMDNPKDVLKKSVTQDPLNLEKGLPGIDLLDRCPSPTEELLFSVDNVERFEERRGYGQEPNNLLPETTPRALPTAPVADDASTAGRALQAERKDITEKNAACKKITREAERLWNDGCLDQHDKLTKHFQTIYPDLAETRVREAVKQAAKNLGRNDLIRGWNPPK